MKIEEIKELIQALEQSSLTSLELTRGETSVKLTKNHIVSPVPQAAPSAEIPVSVIQAAPFVSNMSAMSAEPAKPVKVEQPEGRAVTCPLVGVFYAAPSPNDAPFVSVGSTVKKGDVLCIVEAMKLMNEITAEQDGTITEICVENGQVVEFGQPLFYLA
ncbi:MAG: acetyl-CoA carboxylase biotin carboxyl carrier protein [Peptococcaceae bacterium]|nr:acetyl-CoA carboxylase biotin carboxyl carrier protein [Peptococcaceae bacterium]